MATQSRAARGWTDQEFTLDLLESPHIKSSDEYEYTKSPYGYTAKSDPIESGLSVWIRVFITIIVMISMVAIILPPTAKFIFTL